jgi:hypothetical protein
LSTISDVSISSISNALSDNNNSSEIPYDNYCYYPITSDLSTISDASISDASTSDVSISSFSNASISDASISDGMYKKFYNLSYNTLLNYYFFFY